jgi:Ferritin-like domain
MSKEKISKEEATAKLMASFSTARSRRSLLKGAVTASGITLAGIGALNALPARASVINNGAAFGAAQGLGATSSTAATADSIASILSIARTAEQLAVTFYSNGLNNAGKLGITGDELDYLKAALVEEQIHQQFFTANGGQSIAATFSFPKGAQTFTDLKTFIDTQQQLEGVFDSAFLAAIKEFAQLGRPDLAQIAGQIACIEAEHRALGRVIGKLSPADNWAFTPVLIATVGDAPALVKKAGYLSPESGNSYTYQEVSTDDAGVEQRKPFSVSSTAVGNG